MSDTDSLSSRFKTELFSVSSVVTLTAAVLAIVALFATAAWSDSATVAFGVVSAIGVGVPSLYREWSVELPASAAVLWTGIVSVIACGLYILVFVLATRLGVSAEFGALLALALTVSLGLVFSLYRARIA